MTGEEILARINDGQAKQAFHPEYDISRYYLDRGAVVYSLYDRAKPKCIDVFKAGGLFHCTLYVAETGAPRRFMLGDIMAYTFLDEPEQSTDNYTVIYLDDDVSNNRPENLKWASEFEQKKQVQRVRNGISTGPNHEASPVASNSALLTPIAIKPEKDPLLEQLHVLTKRNEENRHALSIALNALRPFAKFNIPHAQIGAPGSTTIYESNVGSGDETALTAQNFRDAAQAMEDINANT